MGRVVLVLVAIEIKSSVTMELPLLTLAFIAFGGSSNNKDFNRPFLCHGL